MKFWTLPSMKFWTLPSMKFWTLVWNFQPEYEILNLSMNFGPRYEILYLSMILYYNWYLVMMFCAWVWCFVPGYDISYISGYNILYYGIKLFCLHLMRRMWNFIPIMDTKLYGYETSYLGVKLLINRTYVQVDYQTKPFRLLIDGLGCHDAYPEDPIKRSSYNAHCFL
jgi:hypothetical protein